MSGQAPPTETFGPVGEPCRGCGAQLAPDQRYCLNCGQRHGSPRLDFRQRLHTGAAQPAPQDAAPVAQATATPPAERPPRDYTPLAAVGGIAVLGLMLLIGVLIGKGDSPSTSAAPPQVVRVEGTEAGQTTASENRIGKKDEAAARQKKARESGGTASDTSSLGGGKSGDGPVQASDAALKELQEQSPDEYSENSAKLPDEIATGGAPPPTDNKAAGGGSKATAIE